MFHFSYLNIQRHPTYEYPILFWLEGNGTERNSKPPRKLRAFVSPSDTYFSNLNILGLDGLNEFIECLTAGSVSLSDNLQDIQHGPRDEV